MAELVPTGFLQVIATASAYLPSYAFSSTTTVKIAPTVISTATLSTKIHSGLKYWLVLCNIQFICHHLPAAPK